MRQLIRTLRFDVSPTNGKDGKRFNVVSLQMVNMVRSMESLLKEWIGAVDLLELISLDQLLYILKKVIFFLFCKQPILMRRSICN